MSHGDVLISTRDHKEVSLNPLKPVIASDKTMKLLQSKPSTAANVPTEDPWTHRDPWSDARAVAPPVAEVIENRVFERLQATLKDKSDDVTMDETRSDIRIGQLEEQVKAMTDNLQQFQQHQQAQNNQAQGQLTSMKHQLDTQSANMQQVMETKFEEQSTRLDCLLSKRLKAAD